MISAIEEVTGPIAPPDEQAALRAVLRLNSLTKPPGSLGQLEALAVRLAGISKTGQPSYGNRPVVALAADHGVGCEGVSVFPQEVTVQMAYNFLSGGAAVNVLARKAGASVQFVDIGIQAELEHPELINRKVRHGTDNMAEGPAKSREEATEAEVEGVKVAQEAMRRRDESLINGKMGIGNNNAKG
ncbi:nicotinate-nucleotide--dimethylbenzimidazole phosphoribosyltransferase, partial [Paenibacillus riograndensis]